MNKSASLWFFEKTALVTGATSGIGLEMARLLVERGCQVIISGRDEARLEAALTELNSRQPGSARGLAGDLSQPQSRRDFLRRLTAEKSIDILINNAGFGYMGKAAAMPAEDALNMDQLNIAAVLELCQTLLPQMAERRSGGILNIGSVASFFPTPGSAVYSATKSFVRSFTDALHAELDGSGIHVTGLYPGKTNTKFLLRATAGRKGQWQGGMDADVVASAGLDGLARNRVRVIPGLYNRILSVAGQVLPVEVVLALSRKQLSSEIS